MIPKLELGNGVFADINDAIEAAAAAQKDYEKNLTIEDSKRIVEAVRKTLIENAQFFSDMEYEETGYGRPEDKIQKNLGNAIIPGVETLPMSVYSADDNGMVYDFYSPFGVIGALTPVTNPSATIAGNGICNLSAGNAVVFNAHPAAKVSTAIALQTVNKAVVAAGGPNNMLTCIAEPTLDTLDVIAKSPLVSLMIGTGGPAMVATLMKSGKKCICAGPGNPPSIVDETCNLAECAPTLIMSHSLENNTLCIGEKEVFVVDAIFDDFIEAMKATGMVRMLTDEEAAKVTATALQPNEKEISGYSPVKKFVGKNANVILEAAGVACEGDPRTAVMIVDNDHPFVQTEQLMPILPVVRCKDFEEAMERAVAAEHGNRHSASIWSEDIKRVTAFGKAVKTTAYVQCAMTMTAVPGSPTIATPTGEGPTGPWTFLRKRRLSQGGGRGYIA